MGWQVSYPSSELEKVIKKEMKRVQKILLTKPEPTLQTLTFSKQHKDAFRLVLKLEDYKPSFFNIVYVVSCRLLEYKVSKEILNELADEGYIEQLVNSYKFTKKGLEAALAIGVINPFRYEHLLRKKRKK
jgi:predicted transcriptional regulator